MVDCVARLWLLPLVWIDFFFAPFRNFTFTDPPDFLFASLIVLTLAALAARNQRRPHPPRWTRFARASVFALALLTPLVPLTVLYLLSWRAEDLIGHWPRPMIDDPQRIGQNDPAFQSLHDAFVYAGAFAGWGMWSFGALVMHLRRGLTRPQRLWLAGAFLLAWGLFVCEPGGRYAWWID